MLAFASLRSGEPKIWLISPDGGDATLLETGLSGDHYISWSPDGTRIAFMSNRRGKREVWITAVSGGEPFCFTAESDSSIAGSWPTWAPDAKKIAFASNHAGNQDIWIKDVK